MYGIDGSGDATKIEGNAVKFVLEIIMCFDIVHTDLCGPMDSITSSGNRYAMTVIDGFSRFFVTYLLKNKSEAAGRLKDM